MHFGKTHSGPTSPLRKWKFQYKAKDNNILYTLGVDGRQIFVRKNPHILVDNLSTASW